MKALPRTAVLATLAVLLLPGCTGIVFQPEGGLRTDPGAHGIEYRDVRFQSSDGVRLHAWFIPAVTDARGTVVLAHGNAENISTHAAGVVWLRQRGYNVFAFDYRGYGRSGGTPTMVGVHRDTVAALRAADRADALPRDRLVLLGQSLGGAVSVVTVAHLPEDQVPGALVIDSAPTGYRTIAREKLADWWLTWPLQVPLSWLITDDYAALEAADRLPPIPKLFIANRKDPTIPAQHVQRLCAAATPPVDCWEIAVPGHVATFAVPVLRDRFVRWLDTALNATDDRDGLGTSAGFTPR